MALKIKRIKIGYQWRLFFPLIGLLWAIIAGMMLWQYKHEEDIRFEEVRKQMKYINARILFERDIDSDVFMLFKFLSKYHEDDPVFRNMRISVYDAVNQTLIYNLGPVLPFDENDRYGKDMVHMDTDPYTIKRDQDKAIYFSVMHSDDNSVVVYSAVSYDEILAGAFVPATEIWVIVLIIAAVVTVIAFISTHYIARTIKVMRDFATRAARDPLFVPNDKFPSDEFGEIGRQIIHIFNERAKAMIESEREHQATIRAMEEQNNMKRRMTNNVSHELKTPVCIVKGYIDTLVENPDMDEASRLHFMKKAQENINRMTELIKDVSILNRFDEASEKIPMEPIDFHDVVMTVEDENEESGLLNDMKFVNTVPEGTIVEGNFSLLVAMFHNLTKNAALYSGGTEIGVRLIDETKDSFIFEFYDNGNGVAEEHLPHLFERFYCVDSGRARKSCGTGLGLPIVHDTVTSHGGDISVSNSPNGGLVFKFSLNKGNIATTTEI